MFQDLKEKWKVDWLQFTLIICTFAFGGSFCGYAGKKILSALTIESGLGRVILYILIVCIIWPFSVLLVSIPFGQFSFFKDYIQRILRRFSQTKQNSIAIFASGTGTNARKILEHFANHPSIRIALIVSNKPNAGVLEIAKEYQVPALIIEKERFFRGDTYLSVLRSAHIDFIVLAGFLWKVPSALIAAYPNKIVNIHPALLPKYGGKGMYGQFVHEAVINAKERESGITIHYVDDAYDHGSTIFQATCPVLSEDTPDELAKRIHALEHAHFASIIEQCLLK